MRAILWAITVKATAATRRCWPSLLQMLPDDVTPIVLSGNPVETNRRYGVEARDRMNAFESRSTPHLRCADLGRPAFNPSATSTISPFYYGGLMGLAQQMGLKLLLVEGNRPLNREITRKLSQQCFAGCTAVSVRDKGSATLLADWQIPFTFGHRSLVGFGKLTRVWFVGFSPAESCGLFA